MAPLYLNYTTTGRKSFEVFPYPVYDDDTQIEDVLNRLCSKWEVPHLLRGSIFWLVCGIMAMTPWANGRPTFSS